MSNYDALGGVYAAAVTPLRENFSPALDDLPTLLDYLAREGCHGALILGTTGEGPSFSPSERTAILHAALTVKEDHPEFNILAGTGTPSLEETVELTRAAFDQGVDGVVVLPPYYYRKVSDEGLFAWFSQVLERAVPAGQPLLGYHIPPISGVPLSFDLLERLKEAFPDRFAGLKDSSADPEHARRLGEQFGKDLLILNGNDPLFRLALHHEAAGCITALGNLFSRDLRRVWEAHQRGEPDTGAQDRLEAARVVLDRYPPAPPFLKAMLARRSGFPRWSVRPPLISLTPDQEVKIAAELERAL